MKRNERIKNLDSKVLQRIQPGSTRISLLDMPEAEQELYRRTQEICDYVKPEEWTEEHIFLMKEANNRLFFRIHDLFQTSLGAWHKANDEDGSNHILKVRLWYFMFEVGRHIEMMRVEHDLMMKHKKPKDYEKAYDEWWSKRENKTPLWTRESFTRWWNDYVARGYDEYKKRQKKNVQLSKPQP